MYYKIMLFIHTSNQLEQLSLQFASVVNIPLQRGVLKPEMVVVQNAGMARYLSMQVATIGGISANTDYLFPAEFMWRLLRLVSPDIPEKSQCTPDTLRFHIMEELSNHSDLYPELNHYIFNQNNLESIDEFATWQLSCQVADTLDRILFYRSEWIQKWENNPEFESQENWQARLWTHCVTQKSLMHWLHLQEQFKASINTFDKTILPERISFFSMSSLSPGYLELIGEIAQYTDIHIYIINPCQDVYWGDIASEKSRAKLPLDKQSYVDSGNPLLASLGVQGRDFIDQLLNLTTAEHIQHLPIKPFDEELPEKKQTLLRRIQKGIYSLKDPQEFSPNGIKGGRCALYQSSLDNSLVFNACHTAMREVEVLHDQILDALESDPSLTPSDILVMMPDVEEYAPYIESIFTSAIYSTQQPSHAKRHLPFSIADRDPLNVHQLIEVLLKVLQLSDAQYDVESVFEILDYEAVHTSFNLSVDQVDKCRELAKETNIRWGIDAAYRVKNDFPKTDEHTWKYSLKNSLLGYALGENNSDIPCEELFKMGNFEKLGLFAYNEIEGSDAIMLADFKYFTDVVFKVNQWKHQKQSLATWIINLSNFIKQLFSADGYASDLEILLKVLNELNELTDFTQFNNKLSFNLFIKVLQSNLQKIQGHEKFLSHGITFCAMVPMRSVPFQVIAIMGMNDGEYPRQDKYTSFDEVVKKPRRGDRSRRDEDRYLFLESILAARSRLIISYVGQSVKDNTTLPPSVLVSELLDVIEIVTGTKPESIIRKHPLQAFSPRYFQNTKDQNTLFSYAKQYSGLVHNKKKEVNNSFITTPLEELDDSFKTVSIEQLIQFYQSPARYFLKTRFDIKTYDENIILPTREPFKIERFKDRDIRELIMQSECKIDAETVSVSNSQEIARAKGLLPYGDIGDALYKKEENIIEQFRQEYPSTESLSSERFSIEISSKISGEFVLHGVINNCFDSNTRIIQKMGKAFAHDAIALWIPHLVLNTQSATQTEFRSPEECFSIKPVENAQQLLISLIENYWKGLHFPLPFFTKSAYDMFKDKGTENLSKAVTSWNGNDKVTGESEKFENWLLYRDVTISMQPSDEDLAVNEEFRYLSHEIIGEFFKSFSLLNKDI